MDSPHPLIPALDALRWLAEQPGSSVLRGATLHMYDTNVHPDSEAGVSLSSWRFTPDDPNGHAGNAAFGAWFIALGAEDRTGWYTRSVDELQQRELRLVHDGLSLGFVEVRQQPITVGEGDATSASPSSDPSDPTGGF